MNHAQAPGARLQQQPQRFMDRQQQQSSGSREFQPHRSQPADVPVSQMGGANHEGGRKYPDKAQP
ncbi:hypothetical protein ACEN8I_08085 [Polaromonas sp. CT11-55]|uniref:hypothetical protein n=1 Tax=Polaromonas sp. CT11-55 TaxID=3243045 RepID=UPI0039A4D31D